jgi:predicted dehydrogenase
VPGVCVVGAGRLSSRRIYPYLGAAGGRLTGVCDLDEGKANFIATRFGGRPYTDMDRMLEVERPDGVILCTGPAGHERLAKRVLALGLPVYTEKPPAETAAGALSVARAAAQAGRLCMTAFKKRYSSAFERARRWVDELGSNAPLLSLSVDYASGAYRGVDEQHRGFLLDFAIHQIDLVGYLFGDVAEVFSFARGANAYAVSLRFRNGAVGTMNLTDGRSFAVPTEEVELTAAGGNFMTIRNSSFWRVTQDGTPSEWREPTTFISSGDSGNDTGHFAELVQFIGAIAEGRTTSPSEVYQAYKSMVLYEAIVRSVQTGALATVTYEELR